MAELIFVTHLMHICVGKVNKISEI